MNVYEKLLDVANGMGLSVEEYPFREHDGLIIDNKIGIRRTIPTYAQKADVLCEEICHARYTVGNILDQSEVENCKQERKARLLAHDMRIGLNGIIRAYNNECYTLFDMADYLDTSEEFLLEALLDYRNKYGEYADVNEYRIYFEPSFNIVKMEV